MTRTKSEGLAGFVAYKGNLMPSVDGNEFVFETVEAKVFEQYETEYVAGGFSAVQSMTMRCGKKRREARSNNHN